MLYTLVFNNVQNLTRDKAMRMKLVHTKMANKSTFLFCSNTHENRLISTSNDVLLVSSGKLPHRRAVQ